MERVPQWRREIAQKFKKSDDAVRSLAAYLLAANVIAKSRGCLPEDIKISLGKYGKPELVFPTDCFFNISHSGEWVACAVDTAEVGVDIQKIKPTNIALAHRFFAPEEYLYIQNQPEDSRLEAFFETWSLKESYLKAQGTGLHRPLGSFCICRDGDQITVRDNGEKNQNCILRRLDFVGSYVLTAAGAHDISGVEIVDEDYNSFT
jgi:4'-phosphopantetheinyl transferase